MILFVVESNITLYAHWTYNMCKVTFDTRGGTCIDSRLVEYGSTFGEACEGAYTEKENHEFLNWELEDDIEIDEEEAISGDVTLYASWIQK